MCCLSSQRSFCLGEAFFFQNIHYCLAIIALNDDFAVFYGATDTTTLFQEAAQSVEFVVGSDEASDDCDSLSSTSSSFHINANFLPILRNIRYNFLTITIIHKVRVCRIHYTDTFLTFHFNLFCLIHFLFRTNSGEGTLSISHNYLSIKSITGKISFSSS